MPELREPASGFVVTDVAASLGYYTQALGFAVAWTWGEPVHIAGVCRDAVQLQLQAASATDRPVGGGAVYTFTDDADALHAELAAAGALIIKAPADQAYGVRDFVVHDPDGNMLSFAAELQT